MRLKKRLLSFVLAAILVISGALLSSTATLSVRASGLYGAGSADEINIIKLLDMALNRGGISMSPATIQEFLNYWWSSVQGDLSKCINNASDAIATTQAFSSYVISALENADHYDRLGPIMVKYVQYVCALEGKSLSDIRQLLTQEGTFRRFLLSYVTDEDGNIAGTVDNKLKKYNLKGGLVNMVRQAADAYIDEYEGYWMYPSFTCADLSPSQFPTKAEYDSVIASLKTIPGNGVFVLSRDAYYDYYFNVSGENFVGKGSYTPGEITSLEVSKYDSNWTLVQYFALRSSRSEPGVVDLSKFSSDTHYFSKMTFFPTLSYFTSNQQSWGFYFTSDGRAIKVWKSLDAFKASSVGKSDIYYSSNYSSYDSSVDNSIEFTGSYYSSTNNTYSHDVIQTSIDNSQETINESTVNNITNQTINNITNNYYTDSSGSGSGSGSGSDNWWNIGEGIEAFIKGVAELLDFVLKLLGDLIGLLASFATSVLDVLKGLAEVGTSFGDFLKEVFGFLPDECISLIISSIGAMCLVGIIKAFKK